MALKFGIEVSTYSATDAKNPSSSEFASFLQDFDGFCAKNKNSTCDMLMLTGFHGDYEPAGILNNLSKKQLHQLVQTAEKHKVKFNQILADSCCAAFGLKELESILANGGEAIGDRMTSTAYRMQDKLIEKMRLADDQHAYDEKALINVVIEEGMNTFNAPIYIRKNDQKITAVGTTDMEVYRSVIDAYKSSGLIDAALSYKEAEKELRQMGLGADLDMIKSDLKNSRKLFTIDEKTNRAELLSLRKQHLKPQQEPSQEPSLTTLYPYKNNERFHLFHASSENLSEKFQGLRGDYLKEKILNNFREKLQDASSKEALGIIVEEIKSSNEFKTLEKGQGLTTRVFNLKTSSVKAFEEMVKEQEKNIEENPMPKL